MTVAARQIVLTTVSTADLVHDPQLGLAELFGVSHAHLASVGCYRGSSPRSSRHDGKGENQSTQMRRLLTCSTPRMCRLPRTCFGAARCGRCLCRRPDACASLVREHRVDRV